jgi:hypothetical protein
MDQLSLPSFNYRLKNEDDKTLIFDQIRKKYIVLTPEEWVRQHYINYLITALDYPKALINVEQGLRYNSLLKRSDIVVFGRDGKPIVLIECKAAKHSLNQKVVEQAVMYNRTIGARYIIVANGIESACLSIDIENSRVDYLQQVPRYQDL